MADDGKSHLTLGLTPAAMREFLTQIGFSEYKRPDDLSWVPTPEYCTYDVAEHIRRDFKGRGLRAFSATEHMLTQEHAGTGAADIFISHAQNEPFEAITMHCIDLVNARFRKHHGRDARFFLDAFSLRQCLSDFDLPKIEQAIADIGWTVMVASDYARPYTLTRTFCNFELSASMKTASNGGNVILEVVMTKEMSESAKRGDWKRQKGLDGSIGDEELFGSFLRGTIRLHAQDGQCRNAAHKAAVDAVIESRGGGYSEFNKAMKEVIIESICQALFPSNVCGASLDALVTRINEMSLAIAKPGRPLPENFAAHALDKLEAAANTAFEVEQVRFKVGDEMPGLLTICKNSSLSFGSPSSRGQSLKHWLDHGLAEDEDHLRTHLTPKLSLH